MIIKCTIDKLETLKKGGKLIISLGNEAIDEMTIHYKNFRDKPLVMDLRIDAAKHRQIMAQITEDQRKKIYAILKDVGNHFGYADDEAKHTLKPIFLQAYPQYTDFSLSNCSKELASDFIEFMIMFCFKQGVPLADHPREAFEDIEKYLWICLKLKKCCITGKLGRVHHVDAIGMGRDRRNYDDSQHLKICLSDELHTEAHQIGWETFAEKYHVIGILFE